MWSARSVVRDAGESAQRVTRSHGKEMIAARCVVRDAGELSEADAGYRRERFHRVARG